MNEEIKVYLRFLISTSLSRTITDTNLLQVITSRQNDQNLKDCDMDRLSPTERINVMHEKKIGTIRYRTESRGWLLSGLRSIEYEPQDRKTRKEHNTTEKNRRRPLCPRTIQRWYTVYRIDNYQKQQSRFSHGVLIMQSPQQATSAEDRVWCLERH
ncbi:hypothetical protein Trydic_g4246 [Trypoxylus dichotomus]